MSENNLIDNEIESRSKKSFSQRLKEKIALNKAKKLQRLKTKANVLNEKLRAKNEILKAKQGYVNEKVKLAKVKNELRNNSSFSNFKRNVSKAKKSYEKYKTAKQKRNAVKGNKAGGFMFNDSNGGMFSDGLSMGNHPSKKNKRSGGCNIFE